MLLGKHIKNVGLTYISKFGVTVIVVSEIDPGIDNLLVAHKVENALTDHSHTVIDAQNSSFYHG